MKIKDSNVKKWRIRKNNQFSTFMTIWGAEYTLGKKGLHEKNKIVIEKKVLKGKFTEANDMMVIPKHLRGR